MGKVIAAGHICLDITPKFSKRNTVSSPGELLVPGKLVNVEEADVHSGGSVANTGLALKLLGNDVELIGKVGKDAFGELLQGILASYGVSGLTVDAGSVTSYSVVIAVPGADRIFLHCSGANDTFTDTDIPEEALEGAELFHFGYPPIMKRMYENGGEELVRIFRRMKDRGIVTSLDMAAVDPMSEAGRADWNAILKNVLPYVDFFVPSFEEVCFMLDRDRYDRLSARGGDMTEHITCKEVEELSERIMGMGCRVVMIKCGVRGMMYRTAGDMEMAELCGRLSLSPSQWCDKSGIQPCFAVDNVRSATGAGDTSIAAFLTAVRMGKSPEECVRLAAAEGACCVTGYDALSGLRTIPELEKQTAAGWKTGREAFRNAGITE